VLKYAEIFLATVSVDFYNQTKAKNTFLASKKKGKGVPVRGPEGP
jgi:hypothetical protein